MERTPPPPGARRSLELLSGKRESGRGGREGGREAEGERKRGNHWNPGLLRF